MKTIAIALLLAFLLLGGCAHTEITLPDGTNIVRDRFLDSQKLGSVSYDATDGSFTLDGWESDQARLIALLQRLMAVSP